MKRNQQGRMVMSKKILVLFTVLLPCFFVASAWAANITLNFNSLPSAQGWIYEPPSPDPNRVNQYTIPESSVFSVSNGTLYQNTMGVGYVTTGGIQYDFLDSIAPYTVPLTLKFRARVLESESFSPGYIEGFCVGVYEPLGYGIYAGFSTNQININSSQIINNDNTQFHDYRIQATSNGYEFYIDGSLLASGPWYYFPNLPSVFLGDSSGGSHAKAEMTQFSFVQTPITGCFTDNFNDNSINLYNYKIQTEGSGPSVYENNQRLEISFPEYSTGTTDFFSYGIQSMFKIDGDFDIQVNYDCLTWPYSSGVRIWLAIFDVPEHGQFSVERTSFGTTDLPYYPREVYVVNDLSDNVRAIETSDDNGKLRMTRYGSTLSGYYWNSVTEHWDLISSTTNQELLGEKIVGLTSGSTNHDFADKSVKISFDNLIINAESIKYNDQPYSIDLYQDFPAYQGDNGLYAYGYAADTNTYWLLSDFPGYGFTRPEEPYWGNPNVWNNSYPWVFFNPSGTYSNSGHIEDAVLAWVCPENSIYQIAGTFHSDGPTNGADTYIKYNDTILWSSFLQTVDTKDFSIENLLCNAGDTIYFGVGAHNDNSFSECNDWVFLKGTIQGASIQVNVDPTVAGYVSTVQTEVLANNQPIQENYVLNGCKLITPETFNFDADATKPDFNPAKPSMIFIHGWNTDGIDEIWSWDNQHLLTGSDYYKMAEAVKDDVNVFIWDWTTWATSAEAPPVDNAFASAGFLQRLMMDYFEQYPGYGRPIQFVAHSLGGPVALTAAKGLNNLSYHGMTFDIDQVTLLDPYYCAPLLNDVDYDFYVDHYASMVSRAYFPLDLGNYTVLNSFIYGADVNVLLNDVEIFQVQDFSNAHSQAVKYYLATITNQDIPAGYQWSVLHPNNRPEGTASQYYLGYVKDHQTTVEEVTIDAYFDQAQWKEIREITCLVIQGAMLYDDIVHHPVSFLGWLAAEAGIKYLFGDDNGIELTTGSPVYVYQSLTLPANAVDLSLTYKVTAADDDSYIALMINDDLLYYAPANQAIGAETNFVLPDISQYAGQTVYLTFLADDPDSTTGATVDLLDVEIGEGYSFNPYTFACTYADGDSYRGTVYAATDQGYFPGDLWTFTDENGQTGNYTITGVSTGSDTYAAMIGQVHVDLYHDTESGHDYTPLNHTSPLGADYLGSESGYIVSSGNDAFRFGNQPDGSFAEADAVNRYSFVYTYDSGDSYSGDVYATAAEAPSLIAIASSDNGYGHYAWQNEAFGFAALANPVQVTAYYDAGTRHSYAASNTAGAFGSETAWFYGAGGSFTFAPTSAVDLVNRYSFVYNYTTSGDSYYGDVYATQAQADAFSQPTSGHYDWMNMAWGFAPLANPANPVRVTAYYDDSSRRLYAASNTTGLFGYETGRFYGAGGSFSFGPASAVDLVNRYGFVYAYNTGGDYYYGDVYATAVQAAAFSQPTSGHYNWMDMASGFAPLAEPANPVRVTAYYDDSSRHMYAVDSTTAALGAETGQFYGYSASFSFGPASAVDLVNRYTFAYLYNSGGDRYSGQAYATAAQAEEAASPPAFTGHLGDYQFVDMAWGFTAAQPNPVQLTSYYDASSSHLYAVYRNMGTLGSETAWFMGASGYPVNFGVDLEAE